jgi:hypothetical protein
MPAPCAAEIIEARKELLKPLRTYQPGRGFWRGRAGTYARLGSPAAFDRRFAGAGLQGQMPSHPIVRQSSTAGGRSTLRLACLQNVQLSRRGNRRDRRYSAEHRKTSMFHARRRSAKTRESAGLDKASISPMPLIQPCRVDVIELEALSNQGRYQIPRGEVLMKVALLTLFVVASASPVLASRHHAYQDSGDTGFVETSAVTCETVRSYVRQLGLAHAKAVARANGMTPAQEWRARQCLAKRD